MKEDLTRITGLTHKERNSALSWFCKQAESIRVEIMMGRFHSFHELKKMHHLKAPFLDYCSLLLACKKMGWAAEKNYRSSRSIASSEITRISQRRIARALDITHKTSTQERLAVHWGKVVELKMNGLGFRRISQFLSAEFRLNVSHTTIWKLWSKWENNTANRKQHGSI